MRVVDLDREMSDVLPTGTTRDNTFWLERMIGRSTFVFDVTDNDRRAAISDTPGGTWGSTGGGRGGTE